MKISPMNAVFTAMLVSYAPTAYAKCKIPKTYYKHLSCTSSKNLFLAKSDYGNAVALVTRKGKESADLMPYQKVLAYKISNGLMPVMKRGKVGYINTRGRMVIPPIYDKLGGKNWARAFHDNRAVVRKNGKWGVITTSNKVILPFSRDNKRISDFSRGTAKLVTRSGKVLTLTANGSKLDGKSKQKVIKKKLSAIQQREAELQQRKADLKRLEQIEAELKRRKAQLLAQRKAKSRSESKAHLNAKKKAQLSARRKAQLNARRKAQLTAKRKAQLNTKRRSQLTAQRKAQLNTKRRSQLTAQRKVNTSSRVVHNPPMLKQNSYLLSEKRLDNVLGKSSVRPLEIKVKGARLIPAMSDGKWGFVDSNSVEMITYSFDEVAPFSNGLAGVRLGNKWGFIDKAGDVVVDFIFSDASVVKNPTSPNSIRPFVFYDNEAWVGNLKDGSILCINQKGQNIKCSDQLISAFELANASDTLEANDDNEIADNNIDELSTDNAEKFTPVLNHQQIVNSDNELKTAIQDLTSEIDTVNQKSKNEKQESEQQNKSSFTDKFNPVKLADLDKAQPKQIKQPKLADDPNTVNQANLAIMNNQNQVKNKVKPLVAEKVILNNKATTDTKSQHLEEFSLVKATDILSNKATNLNIASVSKKPKLIASDNKANVEKVQLDTISNNNSNNDNSKTDGTPTKVTEQKISEVLQDNKAKSPEMFHVEQSQKIDDKNPKPLVSTDTLDTLITDTKKALSQAKSEVTKTKTDATDKADERIKKLGTLITADMLDEPQPKAPIKSQEKKDDDNATIDKEQDF